MAEKKDIEETVDEITDETMETQVETEVEVNEEAVNEIEELQDKLAQMEDKYLRASAEISNIGSRNKNERELLVRYRSQDLGKKLLPAVDNLERALATEVKDEQGASLKKGVEMVLESIRNAFREEGIEEIHAAGEKFDPTLHQAVQTIPAGDDIPADTVVEVLQKGYKLQDRVLRPAMVIVAQ